MYVEKFFDFLSILATWLSILPHYNVQKCKVWICTYCKICAILKIIVLLIVHVLSLYCKIKFWYNNTTIIMSILDVELSFIECSITILIVWRGAFGNLKDWKKCLSLITKQTSCKRGKWRVFVRFCVSQSIPVALIAISACFWTNIIGFDTYKYFIVGDVERYYNCALFFLYVTLVVQLRQEFIDINKLLVDMIKNMKGYVLDTKGPIKIIKLDNWTASGISEIAKTYLSVYELTRSINNIFGWQILLLIAHAVIVMLNFVYSSVWLAGQNAFEDSNVTVLLYVNITLTLWSMVSRILINISFALLYCFLFKYTFDLKIADA